MVNIKSLVNLQLTKIKNGGSRMYLKRIIIILLLCFNLSVFSREALRDWSDFASVEQMCNNVEQMYEDLNLGECPLFVGNFINFGYWENPMSDDIIHVSKRLESEKDLYRYVINQLNISPKDKILEVGTGLGVGCVLILEEYNPKFICGMDFCKAQVDRATNFNQNFIQNFPNKLSFIQGAAEKIPYKSNTFDKVFSIEAAQHFVDLDKFAKEAYRVLKLNGQFIITTYFATSKQAANQLPNLIPIIEGGTDHAYPVLDFKQYLEQAGFKDVKIESIGQHVWQGYDKWIFQIGYGNTWNKNWYKAYKQGLIDYYIIKAKKVEYLKENQNI